MPDSCITTYPIAAGERHITLIKKIFERSENMTELATREERVALLKAGFTDKDIESQYLKLNGFIVIGGNRKDHN